jgi:hypothetical protein
VAVTEPTHAPGLPEVSLANEFAPPTVPVPNRASGIAGLVRSNMPTATEPPAPAPAPAPSAQEPSPEPPASSVERQTSPELGDKAARAKVPTTLYVSAGVEERINRYRRAVKGRTNTSVVLEAITACRDRLDEIVAASRATGSVGSVFPTDPSAARYLGGGSNQVQIRPTLAQLEVLDQMTAELGFRKRATWIAAVLNDFLPGRREHHH